MHIHYVRILSFWNSWRSASQSWFVKRATVHSAPHLLFLQKKNLLRSRKPPLPQPKVIQSSHKLDPKSSFDQTAMSAAQYSFPSWKDAGGWTRHSFEWKRPAEGIPIGIPQTWKMREENSKFFSTTLSLEKLAPMYRQNLRVFPSLRNPWYFCLLIYCVIFIHNEVSPAIISPRLMVVIYVFRRDYGYKCKNNPGKLD